MLAWNVPQGLSDMLILELRTEMVNGLKYLAPSLRRGKRLNRQDTKDAKFNRNHSVAKLKVQLTLILIACLVWR